MSLLRMCFIFLKCSEAGRLGPHTGLIILYASLLRQTQCVYVKKFSHGGLRIQQIDTIKSKHFFCFPNDPHLSACAPGVHPPCPASPAPPAARARAP